MRLIDADALAASLGITNMDCLKCDWHGSLGCKRGSDFVAACEAIEDAPTIDTDLSTYSDKLWKMAYERGKAEAQQWIPVTEHLPIIETDVLLTAYDGKRQFVGWIDVFGKWYTSEDEEVVSGYEPLAWMPLPEPYKESSDGE